MKKILLFLFVSLLAFSCLNDDDHTGGADGRLSVTVLQKDIVSGELLTDIDLTDYRFTMNNREVDFPANGIIENAQGGRQTLELSNMPSSKMDPAFDAPRYTGTSVVTVSGDTDASIMLNLANIGVYFDFDDALLSIGAGGNLVAKVDAGEKFLEYSDATMTKIGYFMDEDLEVTLTYKGEPMQINGEESLSIDPELGQLISVKLTGETMADGGIAITASIDVLDGPTDELEWGVSQLVWTTITVTGELYPNTIGPLVFTDNTKLTDTDIITFDENGTIRFQERSDKVIATIFITGKFINIGRRVGDDIVLNYNPKTYTFDFREPVDGVTPIGCVEELMTINKNEETLSRSYKQEADLDFAGVNTANWIPIGTNYSNPFKGDYNGNNYKIHNLNINRPTMNDMALFGRCSGGLISNLTIASGDITGRSNVAAIACYLQDLAIMRNCHSYANVTAEQNGAGGLIGRVNSESTVEDCTHHGIVNSKTSDAGGICYMSIASDISNCANYGLVEGYSTIGGILGTTQGGAGTYNCYNYGEARGTTGIGGIAGSVSSQCVLYECVNEGYVYAVKNAGGIAGDTTDGQINVCENKGQVIGISTDAISLGGIIGSVNGSASGGLVYKCINHESGIIKNGFARIAGIAGYVVSSYVEDCVNYADITGEDHSISGIVGDSRGNVTFCRNYGNITGRRTVGGIVGNNYETAKVRMTTNYGKILGGEYIGGIIGSCYGTCSASVNRGKVEGTSEYAGGLSGTLANGSGYIVACYNEAEVKGNKYVGGVVGGMNLDGLMAACYSVGELSGKEYVGGVCGIVIDEFSTIRSSYWSNYNGVGATSEYEGQVDAYHFADGSSIPNGVLSGWPEESSTESWGINPPGGEGNDGQWWRDLGTKGSKVYPALWWE